MVTRSAPVSNTSAPFCRVGCTSGSSIARRPARLNENQPSTISIRQNGSSPPAEKGGARTQVVVSSGPEGVAKLVEPTGSEAPVADEDDP